MSFYPSQMLTLFDLSVMPCFVSLPSQSGACYGSPIEPIAMLSCCEG